MATVGKIPVFFNRGPFFKKVEQGCVVKEQSAMNVTRNIKLGRLLSVLASAK